MRMAKCHKYDWGYIRSLDRRYSRKEAYILYCDYVERNSLGEPPTLGTFCIQCSRKHMFLHLKRYSKEEIDFVKTCRGIFGLRETYRLFTEKYRHISYKSFKSAMIRLGAAQPRKKEVGTIAQRLTGHQHHVYNYIKTSGNKWVRYSRYLTNIYDDNIIIYHLNKNTIDDSLDNLFPVKKQIFMKVSRRLTDDPVYNKTLLMLAELEYELNERSNHERKRKIRKA